MASRAYGLKYTYQKMETTKDVATTSVDEGDPLAESPSFPSLSLLSWFGEFYAMKQVQRSNMQQSLLARQSSFQSTPRSTFENQHAASNCKSSSLFAVDTAVKSHELCNSSWMIPKESDLSSSTNWEDINATPTVRAQNPSLPDTRSPFDMQTMLASLTNLPENVQHQVMNKLYMLDDSRNSSNVPKDISEALSSACAEVTELERTLASTLAASASNNETVIDVANGRDSGNASGNDSTSKQLTPFQIQANAPDGVGIHLPSTNTSHHVHSLHSSELQNSRSRHEMQIRFVNCHSSNNAMQQYIEGTSDLTGANISLSLSSKESQRMSVREQFHTCPVCKMTFRYSKMLKAHAKLHHNETHPFRCTVCEQKFKRYRTLIQHMYSHKVSKAYKCEICGVTFNYHSNLIIHNRVFHCKIFGLAPPPGFMAFCAFTAARKRSATHSDSAVLSSRTEEPSTSITPEHSREEQLFPCVFCGKKFSKKELLSQHMKSHEFSTTYECEICGQTFSFQSSLARHRSVHSDAVRRHACSMCDMTFSDPNNLKRHQATHLNSTDVKLQTKKAPCYCAKPSSALSRRGLKREFSCTFCDRSFYRKILLSEHMKSHEWRTSYKCATCGETFNFQSSLRKHQSVHSDALGHTSPPGLSSSY